MVVGVVGFVAVAAVMGNAVQLLGHFGPLKKRKIQKFELNQSIKRLINRDLIKIRENKKRKYLELTDKGKRLLLKYELEGLQQTKPPKWDGKFRMVIFDISESRRKTRDELRRVLRGFGFVCVQQSAWVYPYPCYDVIELLKKHLEIRGEVVYMTIDKIEDDEWLRDIFQLNK
jgi:phenylacetic acid degradation operon negative regulatory protein